MNRSLRLLLAVVLTLLIPCYALAEAGLGETIYGAWSEWSGKKLVPSAKLEVEQRRARRVVIKDTFNYRRYVYFNAEAGAWYATSTDVPGVSMRAGSGRWEQKSFEQKREPIGLVNGEVEYSGHWFFEEKGERIEEIEPVTQYRGRSLSRVVCRFKSGALALGVTEQHKLEYELAEGVTGLSFRSSDSAVASVSAMGTVSTHKVGSAVLYAMVDGAEAARIEVVVGTRLQAIKNGNYTLQQAGSLQFMMPKGRNPKSGAQILVSDSEEVERRTFTLQQKRDSAFQFRLPGAQILYLGVNTKAKTMILHAAGKGDKVEKNFGVLRLKGNIDLIYPDAERDMFLSVNESGVPMFKAYDSGDETQRWRIEERAAAVSAGTAATQNGAWIAPVERNGRCYISNDYDAKDHAGVDIASYGQRVSVLAVAKGRVVYAFNGCPHDEPKTGKLKDPCGDDRTYGNVVIIEHERGLRTTYAHLSKVNVKEGEQVAQGQVIGVSGSTGKSTGVHLHFELKNGSSGLDPRKYVDLPKAGKLIG